MDADTSYSSKPDYSMDSSSINGGGADNADQEAHHPLIEKYLLFLNPNSILFRLPVLLLICLLTFGSYYCYDTPAALQDDFESAFNVGSFGFGVLYSVYSWPNVIICFFGGWLIDRVLGLRFGALLFCALVLMGQVVFALGSTIQGPIGYGVAIGGRVLFGLGGESLSVAQSTYCAKWFKGKEFALAFGITLSTSRIGSSVNLNLSPLIGQYFNGIVGATWAGVALCLVSITAGLLLAFYDVIGERVLRFLKDPKLAELQPRADDPVRLTDVIFFPASTWVLYWICDAFYISVFMFVAFGTGYLNDTFDVSDKHKVWGFVGASNALSIPYFVSAFASPVFGFIVDMVGFSGAWITLACSIQTFVLLYLTFPVDTHFGWYPLPALFVMGLAYSMLAAGLWPSVAYIIETRRLGTAYGLMTALQNLGLAIAPLAVGGIINLASYRVGFLVLAGCAASALLMSIVLNVLDFFRGRKINCSRAERRRRAEEAAKKEEEEAEERTRLDAGAGGDAGFYSTTSN